MVDTQKLVVISFATVKSLVNVFENVKVNEVTGVPTTVSVQVRSRLE